MVSAHEDDAGAVCFRCGVTYDCHDLLSPNCVEPDGGVWSEDVKARLEAVCSYWTSAAAAIRQLDEPEIAADIRAALEEIERANKALDDIFTMDPCPKCGHGITRGCYGCEVERLTRDRAEVVEALGPHAHPGLSPAANVVELRKRAEAAEAKLAEAQNQAEENKLEW